jgi:hypothetical protein
MSESKRERKKGKIKRKRTLLKGKKPNHNTSYTNLEVISVM